MLTNLLKIFSPAISLLLAVVVISLIGVFIGADIYLLLVGGFENSLVFGILFLIANIAAWLVAHYVFHFGKLLNSFTKSALIITISTLLMLHILIIYYFIVFYLLTGLNLFQTEILVSDSLQAGFRLNMFILGIIGPGVSIFVNTVLILVMKPPQDNDNEPQDAAKVSAENTEESSDGSFENTISL